MRVKAILVPTYYEVDDRRIMESGDGSSKEQGLSVAEEHFDR